MKRFQCQGIVLKRINYGEADRIVTIITPQNGKLSVIAKGVRKPKSKLAGGIELFAINELTLLEGRAELNTLISSRSKRVFSNMVRDYDVIQVGYKAIQLIHRDTEDEAPKEYYDLLVDTFTLLDSSRLSYKVVEGWFSFQFLKLQGSAPNLTHDKNGRPLSADKLYDFIVSEGVFVESKRGVFNADAIKAWRILLGATAANLSRVNDLAAAIEPSYSLIQDFMEYNL